MSADSEKDRVVTTQLTRKKYKAWTVLSSLMFWSGFLYPPLFASKSAGPLDTLLVMFLLVGGFAWYVATKILIWWHHK